MTRRTLYRSRRQPDASNAAGQQRSYDESGLEPTSTGYLYFQNTIDLTYNGDGEAGKRVETRYTETESGSQNDVTTTYYVRSTVLGGAVIAGVDQFGGKSEGHVYAGGQKITDTSGLHNVNPVTGAWVSTIYSLGVISVRAPSWTRWAQMWFRGQRQCSSGRHVDVANDYTREPDS